MNHIKACFFHFLILFILFLSACGGEPSYTPKPRAYPRVEYPQGGYQQFDEDYCNFTFEYPVYAEAQQDTLFFDEKPANPCWFDIYIPAFDSRLYCSYYPIGPEASFEKLKNDAFELVEWHNKKANFIQEVPIKKEGNVNGFAFIIEGPAASPFQFYLTDSTDNFLRGALYFNTQARPDSLQPIYEFVEDDILHMIETFRWK
ncbi:MAG: hypothetical protein KDD06_26965 [Phaeodactylibacter sp.]|nr:hypothetical protein [Phaeodactylibacter sp.]MCB9263883.1 hypothetical protein [Lewinellaceae bacterium]MCB9288191.1 hypothetical protein [Lewinellaceae bacterium]